MAKIAYSLGDDIEYDEPVRIHVEVEQITVDTMGGPSPDPDWHYTDHHGHPHLRIGDEWPTLRWVVDRTYFCEDCQDEHEEGHWECVRCHEHIAPGTVHRPAQRLYRPGPRTYYVNDEPVTEEHAKKVAQAAGYTWPE